MLLNYNPWNIPYQGVLYTQLEGYVSRFSDPRSCVLSGVKWESSVVVYWGDNVRGD